MDTNERKTIPAEVAAAIVKVMGRIKTLGKDDTNKFQKYEFASIDTFLAAVGPLCAEAELLILQDEDSVNIDVKKTTDDYGKTKESSWLTARYAFTLVHASGAMYGPLHRTVMVPASGAQAFGSAQSYALKQFMRAQFQIPTGDKEDADNQDSRTLPGNKNKTALADDPRRSPSDGAPSDDPFSSPPGQQRNQNHDKSNPLTLTIGINSDGSTDWDRWQKLMEKSVAKVDELVKLNNFVSANGAALTEFSGAKPDQHKLLLTIIQNRRGALAQAPGGRRAA